MADPFVIRDFFQFFRLWLAVIVTVYFGIVTWQSVYGWYAWLAGSDRYVSLLRRYLVVHGLRLRFRTFWGDVIICTLLTIAFLMVWHAQHVMDRIETTLNPVPFTYATTRPAQHS